MAEFAGNNPVGDIFNQLDKGKAEAERQEKLEAQKNQPKLPPATEFKESREVRDDHKRAESKLNGGRDESHVSHVENNEQKQGNGLKKEGQFSVFGLPVKFGVGASGKGRVSSDNDREDRKYRDRRESRDRDRYDRDSRDDSGRYRRYDRSDKRERDGNGVKSGLGISLKKNNEQSGHTEPDRSDGAERSKGRPVLDKVRDNIDNKIGKVFAQSDNVQKSTEQPLARVKVSSSDGATETRAGVSLKRPITSAAKTLLSDDAYLQEKVENNLENKLEVAELGAEYTKFKSPIDGNVTHIPTFDVKYNLLNKSFDAGNLKMPVGNWDMPRYDSKNPQLDSYMNMNSGVAMGGGDRDASIGLEFDSSKISLGDRATADYSAGIYAGTNTMGRGEVSLQPTGNEKNLNLNAGIILDNSKQPTGEGVEPVSYVGATTFIKGVEVGATKYFGGETGGAIGVGAETGLAESRNYKTAIRVDAIKPQADTDNPFADDSTRVSATVTVTPKK